MVTDPAASGTVLITGGTGTVGHAVVPRLRDAGRRVRVLSRRAGPASDACDWAVGDLRTGKGLGAALDGVRTVVHCATTYGRGDVACTRNLVAAARAACRPHVIYLFIVGIDSVPLAYYRAKRESERVLENSGLAWTVLRCTQFHPLILALCATQRRLPALFVPAGTSFQPVDVGEVADRLVDLVRHAGEHPDGRAPELGGPEIRSAADLARDYLAVTGRRRLVVPVPLPGTIFRRYRQGAHLAPDRTVGRISFRDHLRALGDQGGRAR